MTAAYMTPEIEAELQLDAMELLLKGQEKSLYSEESDKINQAYFLGAAKYDFGPELLEEIVKQYEQRKLMNNNEGAMQ